MASLFRRRISLRIAKLVSPSELHGNVENIASEVRLLVESMSCPQFRFSWKRAQEKQLVPGTEITQNALHILNGNGLILGDGVIRVENSQDKHANLVFTIDREHFMKEVLLEAFNNMQAHAHDDPVLNQIPKRKVIVEYSSPNIAKPFHVGHIRSTIIGQVISNLQEYLGNKVKRINYLGDWGTQYGILSAGYDKFANEEEMNNNPMKHLFEVYVVSNKETSLNPDALQKAKNIFTKMEEGDELYLERWRHLRNISVNEFNKVYTRLGVHFDEIQGESMFHNDATSLIQELLDKQLATHDSDGAVRIKVEWPKQDDRSVTLAKNDGSTLYLSRDVAAAISRRKAFDFDSALYIVDKSQTEHFIALKSLLNKMGHAWANDILHVAFGRILGMSTREGNVVFLDELLDEAKTLALKTMAMSENTSPDVNPEDVAEVLGISAVVINDLRLKRMNDYTFNWNRALHHKGDSGMELQYCHARLCSLEKVYGKLLNTNFDPKVLCEPEALHLSLHIARFNEALFGAYIQLEPYILVMYLFRLNLYISKAYRELSLSRQERRIAESRYFLFHTARLVLHEGMTILGLRPLQEM